MKIHLPITTFLQSNRHYVGLNQQGYCTELVSIYDCGHSASVCILIHPVLYNVKKFDEYFMLFIKCKQTLQEEVDSISYESMIIDVNLLMRLVDEIIVKSQLSNQA